jgi:hypothetical protein
MTCMSDEPRWVQWARSLQAIAQTGLHFSESEYDRERYQKILQISVEIFAEYSGQSPSLIQRLFEDQSGYATPKVDVRGVVFRSGKLLFVRERTDGLWTLPGGWADVNDSPSEAVEREILEESGFQTKAESMLAVFDRSRFMSINCLSSADWKGAKPGRRLKQAELIFLGRTRFRLYRSRG